MASNLEQRLYRLETALTRDDQLIAQMQARIATLEQKQYAASAGSGGGGGGGAVYFGCTLSAALTHGSSVTGQTVWKLESGARTNVTTNGTIYNDGPTASNDIASAKQVICLANDDGTYTAAGVYC